MYMFIICWIVYIVFFRTHMHTYARIYIYINIFLHIHTWDRGQIGNLWTAVEYEISKYVSLRIHVVIGKKVQILG